jgi:hypothetical protein
MIASSIKKQNAPSLSYFLDEFIPTLPQSAAISREDACRWHQGMIDRGNGIEWAMKCLPFFRIHEVAEMALALLGSPPQFRTVNDIILEKKLIKLPEIPSRTMRRGIDLEPIARKWFYEDHPASPRRTNTDEPISFLNSRRFPWLHARIEDIVTWSDRSALVDYKATRDIPDAVPLAYQIEMHVLDYLYAIYQKKNMSDYKQRQTPLSVDVLLNVYIDYSSGSVVPKEVAYNPYLLSSALKAGDSVYRHLTVGEPLPEAFLCEPARSIDSDDLPGFCH